MPVQQKDKPAEQDQPKNRQLSAVVGKHVLDILGQPAELRQVQVRPLWDDCYRVNVFVGEDAATVTIAHSFFLVTDAAGNIVSSTPALRKCYGKLEV